MEDQTVKFVDLKEGGDEWADISGLEQYREYQMISGNLYRIDKPIALHVKRKPEGDAHRIIDADGVRHYIPAGAWEAFRFKGKFGIGAE